MADEMLFYGVWPGQPSGHYLRCSTGREVLAPRGASWSDGRQPIEDTVRPWPGSRADMTFDERKALKLRGPEQEGVWHIHRYSDAVVLTCWDRSGDRRHGSLAAFIWPGQHTDEEMMAEAKRLYPRVFQRIAERLAATAGQP